MSAIILTSILLTFIQMLIGSLWYSKFLFGDLFIKYANLNPLSITKDSLKKTFILATILAFIRSLLIYIVTANVVLILPQYFFTISICIILLMMITTFDDFIWGNKSIELILLNMSQQALAILAAFVVARMVIVAF